MWLMGDVYCCQLDPDVEHKLHVTVLLYWQCFEIGSSQSIPGSGVAHDRGQQHLWMHLDGHSMILDTTHCLPLLCYYNIDVVQFLLYTRVMIVD